MITEAKVTPFLHTQFVAPYVKDGQLVAAIVENKTGRGAIRAKMFIDATGDADMCERLGLPTYIAEAIQPSTTCALFGGWSSLAGFNVWQAMKDHAAEFNLPEGFAWGAQVPPHNDAFMFAATRVKGANCANAAELTHSEMEGRRQVRAIMDIIRRYCPTQKISLHTLPARIGIRETRHVKCAYQLSGDDVLYGKRFK